MPLYGKIGTRDSATLAYTHFVPFPRRFSKHLIYDDILIVVVEVFSSIFFCSQLSFVSLPFLTNLATVVHVPECIHSYFSFF